MTSSDLAQLFVKCGELHESSYCDVKHKYLKRWDDCAVEVTDDPFLQQVLYVSLTYSGELLDIAHEYLKPQ